jgi:hypothetical protein
MIHLPTTTANETSFHGTTFKATPSQLIESLGEMDYEGSGDDKTSMEWIRELDNSDVFTIYDWKYYRKIGMDEEITWNIGGHNKTVTDSAKKELLILLSK